MEDNSSDMDMNDTEGTRSCTPHFTSESHGTEKVKSIFKRGLSRSSSRSGFNGSEKFSSFMQIFREATKMTWEFKITLPSDKSWRMKNYFKLLEMQKEKKNILHSMPSQESNVSSNWDPVLLAQPELKRAKFSGTPSVSSEGSIPTCHSLDLSWNSVDIAKAGTILQSNSSSSVSFQDEEEMRRVFTLLYDVYRYKHILNEALLETRFFQKYPEHMKSTSLVWLLFYDLHKRRFLPREHADQVVCEDLFNKIGLSPIEKDLWKAKVKLAASLARNRIKNNALRLNQLLPNHLRDERLVSAEETPITGWINTFKMSKKQVCEKIESFGLKLQSKHETVLTKNDFRFDHLCPKLLLCHPIQRADLAQSVLVKDHTVILQDRAFCIGPAIIAKILSEIPLRGTIAQSHVNSPRTTAYLANILADNKRLDKMIAFGAGDKLFEYQTYLHDLGVNNCEIYAQKFTEIHPEAAVLENLVAIFATPPNSCTGVTDPVDLICSRGGDMHMLNALTQTEVTKSSCAFLEEQKDTLEYCMSLPQVQIILYETHSMAPEENLDMVNKMIVQMNDFAKEKHEEDHRIMLEQEEAEEKMNKPIGIPGMSREREKEVQAVQEPPPEPKELVIPPCDLFELVPLPDLCSHGSECLSEEGCYIARIQRKEIISLDAKYMIKIAEARGLFGDELGQKKSSTMKVQKKKEDAQRVASSKPKPRKVKVEIERITAPTLASIHKMRKDDSVLSSFTDCPRHHFHTLENANKAEVYSARSSSDTLKRKSRSKKCQEESMKRLSRPSRRWSTSSSDLMREVRPSFWRFATAKSVEDLIRALRKRRRTRRGYRFDDYMILQQQQILQSHDQRKKHVSNEDVIPGLQINFFGKKYLYPFRAPFITNTKLKNWSDLIYYPDGEDLLSDASTESGELFGEIESADLSRVTVIEKEKCQLLRQCLKEGREIFEHVENAIEMARGRFRKPVDEYQTPRTLPPKEQPKVINPKPKQPTKAYMGSLYKISELDEMHHIATPHKSQEKKDIVLHERYLPGQQTTVEDKKFIRKLKTKLEKLQGDYPLTPWNKKKKQAPEPRLSAKKGT